MAKAALTVSNLSVSLGRPVLENVSFELAQGSFCGLIGANGSGKTTLLRTILGLQRSSSRSVQVSGGAAAAGAIGYVPQNSRFDPDLPLRARDLVGLGLDGHRLGLPLPSRNRRRLVEEMLDAVDATDFADQRVGRLSGGQQQRVLIAHALIRQPRLLLLDEPLASLDLRGIAEIVALLDRLRTRHDITILLSAHDMNPLMPLMDSIVYLAHGRAVSGPAETVVRTEVLSRLYGYHIDVIRVHGRILVVAAGAPDELPAELDRHPQHVTDIP